MIKRAPVLVFALALAAIATALPSAAQALGPNVPLDEIDGAQLSRLRAVQERVVDIKRSIFAAKQRLVVLREAAMTGAFDVTSRVSVIHDSQLSDAFKQQRITYFLDGKRVFSGADATSPRNGVEVFAAALAEGNHSLSVEATYRGDSALFPYLAGYEFNLRSSYTFYARRGRLTRVRVMPHERAELGIAFEDRPSIKYAVESRRLAR